MDTRQKASTGGNQQEKNRPHPATNEKRSANEGKTTKTKESQSSDWNRGNVADPTVNSRNSVRKSSEGTRGLLSKRETESKENAQKAKERGSSSRRRSSKNRTSKGNEKKPSDEPRRRRSSSERRRRDSKDSTKKTVTTTKTRQSRDRNATEKHKRQSKEQRRPSKDRIVRKPLGEKELEERRKMREQQQKEIMKMEEKAKKERARQSRPSFGRGLLAAKFQRQLKHWGLRHNLPEWAQHQLTRSMERHMTARSKRDVTLGKAREGDDVFPYATAFVPKTPDRKPSDTRKSKKSGPLVDDLPDEEELEDTHFGLNTISNLILEDEDEEDQAKDEDETFKWDPKAPLEELEKRSQFSEQKVIENTALSTAMVLQSPEDKVPGGIGRGSKKPISFISKVSGLKYFVSRPSKLEEIQDRLD